MVPKRLIMMRLAQTFESFLGAEWTPEVKAQWTIAFGVIKEQMIVGARKRLAQKAAA
jgi:hypothetical protein